MFCCRRVVIDNENEMPNDYGTTPGGTIFGTTPGGILFLDFEVLFYVQVNHFQKPSFLHQLTHNMTRDCLLNSKKNTSSQHVVYKNSFLFWHSKQYL